MLKKLLKACHPDVTECPSAAEARFFEELEQELRAANRCGAGGREWRCVHLLLAAPCSSWGPE